MRERHFRQQNDCHLLLPSVPAMQSSARKHRFNHVKILTRTLSPVKSNGCLPVWPGLAFARLVMAFLGSAGKNNPGNEVRS